MKRFQNILFVIDSREIPHNAFQQAASVIQSTGADITFLVLYPNLSDDLKDLQQAYENVVAESIREKLESHNLPNDVHVVFETATPHFVTVIQHVLQKDYDLVIKAAEASEEKRSKGFKSLDMNLLRKCPCPVWLCRDFLTAGGPKIVTAVDPFSETPEAHNLSIKLLQIGQSVAESLGGKNTIVSTWHLEDEDFLRHSPFANMESSRVDELLAEEEQKHKKAMGNLISEAKVSDESTVYERGRAHDFIPSFVERENVDLVVMGTVARTGIPGFLMGNTAENILQKLPCSMFAVKPSGFVTPVKAY